MREPFQVRSWVDQHGTQRCNGTERTNAPPCATIISGTIGGGAVITLDHALVMTEMGLRVVPSSMVQPVAMEGEHERAE